METSFSPAEYFILKQGAMAGPYSLDDLHEGLANGRFSPTELVQTGSVPIWRPLATVFDASGEEAPATVQDPDWKCIGKWAWTRLRYSLNEQSVGAGLVCLGVGVAALILSRWPAVFWVPWLAAATVAGAALVRRRREVAGTLLLVGVLSVLFVVALLDMRAKAQRQTAAEPVTSFPAAAEPTPRMVSPAPEAVVPAVAPPPLPVAVEPVAPIAPIAPIANPAPAVPAVVPGDAGAIASAKPAAPALSRAPEVNAPLPIYPAKFPGGFPGFGTAPSDYRNLVQEHTDAFVIIRGVEGSGSGFVCQAGDRTWLFTNIHVAADLKQPEFTRLDNVPLMPGAAEAAAGPDIVRFALAQPPAHPLEMMTDVDNNVRIGDQVEVLGNSGGGGVVKSLRGMVVGLGPDRIEVSAAFIPGNSGSPIIHVKTGKVIGIATYLTRHYDQLATSAAGASNALVVRRFGYRIDNVPRWEPVNWPAFRAEAEQVHEVSRLTADIMNFLDALRKGQAPRYETEMLRRPATEWMSKIGNKRVSESDRLSATQRFLGSLRAMARGDTYAMEARMRYSYFRNGLREEQQARDQLYEIFDKEATSLISPSARAVYR